MTNRIGTVSLTFDDGPDPRWTPAVLDALRDAGARATFYLVAPAAQSLPRLVRRILDEGHEVGVHCTAHVRHSDLEDELLRRDLRTALATFDALGVRPRGWRPPWGVTRPLSWDLAGEHELDLVGWSADTEDWAGHSAQRMLRRVGPRLRPGAIVLAHDALGPGATRTGCQQTVRLIAPLVERVESLGLACAPVSPPSAVAA